MLMPCPECALNVSDKAIYCPHCGFPLKPEKLPKKMKGKMITVSKNGTTIKMLVNGNEKEKYIVEVRI